MIYKIETCGVTEFVCGADILSVLKNYCKDAGYSVLEDIDSIDEISDQEAERIMIYDYEDEKEISLLEMAGSPSNLYWYLATSQLD